MNIPAKFCNVIDGRHCDARGGESIPVLDPSTCQPFTSIPRSAAVDVDDAVRAARAAFDGTWGKTTATERGRILAKIGQSILANQEELAKLECLDTGKPISQARADISACARYFEYYAGAADKLHGETIPYMAAITVMTVRVPYGVSAHIIPWNYPAQIYGRSVAAALAAGNACVVKPAEDACLTPLAIAALALEAGLAPGALNLVCGLGAEAGAALASHPGIDHMSFTGSTRTGSEVAAAGARNHVPVTMELGGKSPQIVFADADLGQVIPAVVSGIIQNAGQTCTAGSRVLIERSAYRTVVGSLTERFKALGVGPGIMNPDCGPLVNRRQQQKVQATIDGARSAGIRIAGQGHMLDDLSYDARDGCYVLPTLLVDVPVDHAVAREEIFGPVLCVFAFDTEEEAVNLANGTDFGLTAGVWTNDGGRQLRMAHAVRAGQVFVNNYGAGGGVELPFGGFKHSGYGREKAFEGLRSFTTTKTIAIRHG